MSNASIVVVPRGPMASSRLAEDVARAAAHAVHARAVNTRRSYAREWERWEAYAFDHGAMALPASPLVVAAYMAHLDAEGLAPSSLDVAMSAITDRHRAARVPLPSNDFVERSASVDGAWPVWLDASKIVGGPIFSTRGLVGSCQDKRAGGASSGKGRCKPGGGYTSRERGMIRPCIVFAYLNAVSAGRQVKQHAAKLKTA